MDVSGGSKINIGGVGMETGSIAALISVAAAISGVVLGWSGRERTMRRDTAAEAREGATIKSDVEYIKRGVDDLRLEMRDQGRRFDELAERVTRVEESAKQAHHRLNRLEGNGG